MLLKCRNHFVGARGPIILAIMLYWLYPSLLLRVAVGRYPMFYLSGMNNGHPGPFPVVGVLVKDATSFTVLWLISSVS